MLWTPIKGAIRSEHNTGTVGTQTPGTAVTTGAAGATKGAVAELITSTLADYHEVTIMASCYGIAATASEACLDIMIGPATEDVIIPNLLAGYSGGEASAAGNGPKIWTFPLYIPAGSRISAKAAGNRLTTVMNVGIFLRGWPGMPPFRVGNRVTTYGVTVPDGTTVVVGASAAEGTWTQITASTSEEHFALVPSLQLQAETSSLARFMQMDLGIGAATEVEIGSYWWSTDANEKMAGPYPSVPSIYPIPSGSRLTARLSSGTTPVDACSVAIHAVS